MKVLIADDEATSRLLLEATLRRWGYEVVSTCDGDAAWAALQAEDAPELVVLDWMMPGVEGPELCRRIGQMNRSAPPYVILLTALDGREDVVAGLRAGADDYIMKPFHREELRARLDVGRRIVLLRAVLADRIEELERALKEIKTLRGVVPICMHCHRIRDDREAWQRMERYVEEHSEAQFSHSLCPECLERHYPDRDGDQGDDDGLVADGTGRDGAADGSR